MTVRTVITVFCALIFLIAACAPQNVIDAQPLNLSQPAGPDPCMTVKCNAQTHCDNGACVCNTGTKKCGDACIASSKCCADKECGANKFCQNGVCAVQPVCKFNEAWDVEHKECSCTEGTKFCREQGKCVPAKSCCWHNDCGNDFRCALTTYSGEVCLTKDAKKCKTIHESTQQAFVFGDQSEYTVRVQQVLEGGKFVLRVNNETAPALPLNRIAQVANLSVVVDKFESFGGFCREEPA